mmetsp:Transcript_19735/g.46756  ORF Transcript_19735/g.46756 Transcript_19735/m.46756 type:complete len:359 (-) Transcript_19735:175-1251(-)
MDQEGEPELKRPRVEPPAAEAEAEGPAVTEVVAPLLTADAAQGSLDADSATTGGALADTVSASVDTAEAPAVVVQDPVSGNGDSQQPASDAASGRCTGTVKQWRDEKGFGFIAADDGSEDLFVHRTSLQEGDCLIEGAKVSYVQGVDDRKGKAQALQVSGGTTRSAQPNAALSMPGDPFAAGSAPGAGALMGITKSWHAEKRFGFIKPDDGSEDVFVHRTSIQGAEMLQVGARVRYTKVPDGARAKAQDVVIVSPPPFGASPYGGAYGAPPHYAPPPPYGSYAPPPYSGEPPYSHAPHPGAPGHYPPGYPHHGPPGYPAQHHGQHHGQHPGYANHPGAYGQPAHPNPYGGYADYWPPS